MTQQELKNIASVPTQIISPSKCKPIITLVQDTIVASYLMTQDHVRIYKSELCNLMMNIKTFDGKIPEPDGKDDNGIEYWSGRTAFSMILPDISLKLRNNSDEEVIIKNGKYLKGNLDSRIIGSTGLIQDILKMYGTERCHAFIDETQNIFTRWLENQGFSVGIGDAVPIDTKMKDEIKEIIDNKIAESKEQVSLAYQGLYDTNLDDKLRLKSMDMMMKKIAADCENDVLKYVKKTLPKSNRFNIMTTSGAKGKDLNIRQILGVVGQQEIWDDRIHNGFTDRTLPHFQKNDFGLSAKGFVSNSFTKGVNPSEFFFSMMGGRVGMIDTAVRSVTGDTPIVVTVNGKAKRVLIGDWIDEYMDKKENVVEKYDERNLELHRTEDDDMYIPTTDENGNMSWEQITALTRHDPGKYLYKITTLGGRDVIVPESKSMLIWNSESGAYEQKLTPEIKIGDFAPSTQYLPKHPNEMKYIDIVDYLPKTEYIYGTDFHKAYDLVFNKYNKRVPHNWWKENNGTTFTLPYEYTHRLLRVARRSNLENIKEGHVYPYHGKRINTFIPDKLELNRENGVFIGLYLAEGSCDFNSGFIRISNNSPEIHTVVKKWFEKYSVKWNFETKKTEYGTSISIRGYSRILATLFEKWCGKGAANKHIPNEAHTAPDEFIIGLIDGYFSGDGTVSQSSIESGSCSKELTEGIGMLYNRFGIFGKYFSTQTKWDIFGTENILPQHRFAIRSHWARKFADTISLTHDEKNKKLQNIRCTDVHRNFDTQLDTVLDKIVSIEQVDVSQYPKLYDLTVPKTSNFTLSNGLSVYDTAETGYISRRLVKAAEDVKVLYDGTVRNASGNVVSLVYGDDNYDPTKLEKVGVDLIKFNNLEMESKFDFFNEIKQESDWENIILKPAMKDLLATDGYKEKLEAEYQMMMKYRENLRHVYFKNRDIIDVDTFMPFNLYKYVSGIKFKFNIGDKSISDLNPIYVIDRINELCDFVSKYMKDKNSNTLTKIIIRTHLSSKMSIVYHKLNKMTFDYIVKELENKIICAFVQPGEMVGPIGAQSLGEANTQLTLNNRELFIKTSCHNTYEALYVEKQLDTSLIHSY